MKLNLKERKGITLIALVITIIVLLILAGVSIAMLTGQNGILTQANNAKDETEQANAKEKVESAVIATMSQSKRGTLDADKLVAEITNNYGGTATKTGTGFPVNTTVDGKSFTIDGDGNVTSTGSGNDPTERKLLSEITGNETANTPAKDNLGNPITIPAGFEVDNPNDNVEDGIVVRDKTHTKTAGSEFVWIPVRDVKTRDKGTINIELKRYAVEENIDYDILIERFPNRKAMIDEIVDLMVEVLCSKRETMTIASDTHPIEQVKERFECINSGHIEYILECLDKTTTDIRNIKQYLLSVIFNAPQTMDNYYTAAVNYDLYGPK